jgi:putative ABC transport system permease protein
MFSPRWRKVWRDLSGNKTRTLLAVLSISVGVFAVGVIANSQVILTRDLADRFAAIHPSSAVLSTTSPFDDDLVRAVRRMNEIEEAEGRYTFTVRAKKAGAGDWFTLQLSALQDYADIRISKIRHELGAWPPGKQEVLLERASLEFMKARVGESLYIEMPSGKLRPLRVAGTVHDMTAIPPIYSAPNIGFISFDTLEAMGMPRGFNQLYITVADETRARDRDYIQRVAKQIRDDKLEASGSLREVTSIDIAPNPGEAPLAFVTNAMLLILGALSVFVLLASGFLVFNTISALLKRQVKQIGIMKAIGGRTHQIAQMYLVVVVLFGLLALALPIPLVALGARAFSSYMAGILNFDLVAFSFPPYVLALEVAVALIVPLVAALYPILAGTRVTVREAISSHGIALPSNLPLLGEGPGGGRILPRPLLLSLRNTLRRRGRLAFTLIPLTLSGALFISVMSVRASLLRSLDELSRTWRYDVALDLARGYPVDRIEREAMSVPGVMRVEMWDTDAAVRLRADDSESMVISVVAPPAATDLIQPIVVRGRWLQPDDENAVVLSTTLLPYEPDVEIGDTLTLKIRGRKTTWQVVGFVNGGMTKIPYAYMNYPHYARVMREPSMANSARLVTERHDAAFELKVMQAVEEQFKRVGLRVRSTEATTELIERITSGMMVFVVFLLILAVMLAAVGGLGLMGTMSLNVLERTREIGVMRAIGASDGAVLQIVMVESILIGIISWLGGALLAVPMSRVISDQTGLQLFQTPLSYTFAPSGLLIWLGLVVILSAVASFVPARNAARLTVREVLAYE